MLLLTSVYLDKDRQRPVKNNVPKATAISSALLGQSPLSLVSAAGSPEQYPLDTYYVVISDAHAQTLEFFGDILDITVSGIGRITATIIED